MLSAVGFFFVVEGFPMSQYLESVHRRAGGSGRHPPWLSFCVPAGAMRERT